MKRGRGNTMWNGRHGRLQRLRPFDPDGLPILAIEGHDGRIRCGLGRWFRAERQGGTDGGSGTERLNLDVTSELEHTLAHSGDAHAGLAGGNIEAAEALLGNSLAVIADFKLDSILRASETNAGSGGMRMAMHVGEALLQNAEEDEFAITGGAVHLFRNIAFHLNPAAAGEAFDEPARRGSNACLVEQWRVQ